MSSLQLNNNDDNINNIVGIAHDRANLDSPALAVNLDIASSKVRLVDDSGQVLGNSFSVLTSHGNDLATPQDIASINAELKQLGQQLLQLKKDIKPDKQLSSRIQELEQTVQRVMTQGQSLQARVELPPDEALSIRLVPSNLLDRLEEHNSDYNIALIVTSTFGGAILGLLISWTTYEPFVITRFSALLMVLFAILAFLSGFWAWRLHHRIILLREKML